MAQSLRPASRVPDAGLSGTEGGGYGVDVVGNEPVAADAGAPVTEDDPWAMQLVVYRDRHRLARQVDVCETAARAVVLLLDDPRSRTGGPWHAPVSHWAGGRIRKLVRRADGKRWDDVQQLDGVTLCQPGPQGHGEARVRAFVPAPARPLPKLLDKLQVSGTQFTVGGASLNTDALAVLEVTPLAELTSGKMAAQCGHAAQRLYETAPPDRLAAWRADGFRVEVRLPDVRQWAESPREVSILDAGFTELEHPTETARGFWRADQY